MSTMEEFNYCNITYDPLLSVQDQISDFDFKVDVSLTYIPMRDFQRSDMRIEEYLCHEDYKASLKTNIDFLVHESDGLELISDLLSEAIVPEECQKWFIKEILKKTRTIITMFGKQKAVGTMHVQIGVGVKEDIEEEDMDMYMEVIIDESDYSPTVYLEIVVNHREGLDCAICLDEIQMGMEGVRMPLCDHVFHGGCIAAWLRKKTSCPFCREELFW